MYDFSPSRDHTVNTGHTDMIRALFCDEFEIGVDHEALARIGTGDVDSWVTDLRFTGLFLPGEIDAIENQWITDPASLVAVLTGGMDEVSQRRAAHLVPVGDAFASHAAVG
ncbi:MAG: hypothetical protein WBF79_08810 [Rhodococcus sp. (in: high G+C Gram-positive bacteria)]